MTSASEPLTITVLPKELAPAPDMTMWLVIGGVAGVALLLAWGASKR